MRNAVRILGFVLVFLTAQVCGQPIRVHPANPHCFEFKGKPTILITSAEHYGAAVNKDFDYIAHFDALKSYGLSYTRIYPGAMFEPQGKFLSGNTLGPKPWSLIVPWARSNVPGYLFCGNKFDLDRWDPAYFARLKNFITKADERGIVVEICFFNCQYSDTWPISPLYYENNIQGVGRDKWQDALTMKDPDLVRRETDYVRKITEEVNAFDNVILEVIDEPANFTPFEEAGPWVRHMLEEVADTERNLPKKRLLAQESQGPPGGPIDVTADGNVTVIVGQYVQAGSRQQLGGIRALDTEYEHNKPIEFNETDYYPRWYLGDKVAASRVEAWEFIVGGGASFNHLNGLFAVADPAGKAPDNTPVLKALQNLKSFIYSFDFLKIHPDKSFVLSGLPAGAYCRAISQPGQQYAMYHHHSRDLRDKHS